MSLCAQIGASRARSAATPLRQDASSSDPPTTQNAPATDTPTISGVHRLTPTSPRCQTIANRLVGVSGIRSLRGRRPADGHRRGDRRPRVAAVRAPGPSTTSSGASELCHRSQVHGSAADRARQASQLLGASPGMRVCARSCRSWASWERHGFARTEPFGLSSSAGRRTSGSVPRPGPPADERFPRTRHSPKNFRLGELRRHTARPANRWRGCPCERVRAGPGSGRGARAPAGIPAPPGRRRSSSRWASGRTRRSTTPPAR